ncbi:MAG: BON domain-containing protein [Gammaproteobacteria bacterium]|nr:BON domain-containing protein [Gammaproteobacteria bacterium]
MIRRLLMLTIILYGVALVQACAPVILAGGATAAVAANDRRTVGAQLDDKSIEIKSRRTLNDDPKLGDDVHININSMNGSVLLTGEASTAELRDEVLEQIRSVDGIRRVVNEIRITEPTAFANRTRDSWITGNIKTKILATKDLVSGHIKVVTEDSVVYLLGVVDRKEADLATEAARSADGVERVVRLFEYVD